jgi:hypothetical protein
VRVRRKAIIGTVQEYPNLENAWQASNGLRVSINETRNRQREQAVKVADLVDHYSRIELANDQFDGGKSHATKTIYRDFLTRWVRPSTEERSQWRSNRLVWQLCGMVRGRKEIVIPGGHQEPSFFSSSGVGVNEPAYSDCFIGQENPWETRCTLNAIILSSAGEPGFSAGSGHGDSSPSPVALANR